MGKAGDVADGCHQPKAGHRPDGTRPGEPQQVFVIQRSLGPCGRRSRVPPAARRHQARVHLLQRSIAWAGVHVLSLSSRPLAVGCARRKPARQTQTMFVEHRPDLLLEPSGFFHHSLVGAKHLSPLQGFGIGLPDDGGEAAQIDPRDLDGVHAIVGAVNLPDFSCLMAVEDDGAAADLARPGGDGKGVAAGFQDELIGTGGVALRPGFKLPERHARGGALDLRGGRVATAQDRACKTIRMDVEPDDSTVDSVHGSDSLACLRLLCCWMEGGAGLRRTLTRRHPGLNELSAHFTPRGFIRQDSLSVQPGRLAPLQRTSPCRPVFRWFCWPVPSKTNGVSDPAFRPAQRHP